MSDVAGGEVRDALPDDLVAHGYVGPYTFPDNSRRRWPALIYAALAVVLIGIWAATRSGDPVLVNEGYLWVGLGLMAFAVYGFTSGWPMTVRETQALEVATRAVGFPVGHASAQLAWRGLRSRPTWRILCYSTESPPMRRGFVLIDAIDGSVVSHFTEDNPEDWAEPDA